MSMKEYPIFGYGIDLRDLKFNDKFFAAFGNEFKTVEELIMSIDSSEFEETIIPNDAYLEVEIVEDKGYVLYYPMYPWNFSEEELKKFTDSKIMDDYFWSLFKPYVNMAEDEFKNQIGDVEDTYWG